MSWKVSLLRQSRTMLSQNPFPAVAASPKENKRDKLWESERKRLLREREVRKVEMRFWEATEREGVCKINSVTLMTALWHLQKNVSYQSPVKMNHGPTWISLCGIGRQGCQSGWRLCLQIEWDKGCDWLRELKQIFLGYFEWEGSRGIWDRILLCSIS